MFAEDTALFPIVHDANTLACKLNKDLQKISEWSYLWKMALNPGLNKQAQKVIFSRKTAQSSHLQTYFNNVPVSCVRFQKHLAVYIYEKLNCSYHIKEKISKARLPRYSFIAKYKAFVRPHFDYGDILYDQPNSESLCQKLKAFNTMLSCHYRCY